MVFVDVYIGYLSPSFCGLKPRTKQACGLTITDCEYNYNHEDNTLSIT